MDWQATDIKKVLKTHPFTVEEVSLFDNLEQKPLPHPFYRLDAPDWVNVLPITHDGRAILIRQARVGTMTNVLETPGGVIDPHEKDPTLAAFRELEEETGFSSQRLLPLGTVNPNPALMTNKLHMFLALNCQPRPDRKHFPDELERIEVELVPVQELEDLVRYGRINHALSCLTIMLAGKYLQTQKHV